MNGTVYEVAPELAGETVVLWWGLFDTDLSVEYGDQRFGPYAPVAGPIPLHRYRAFKKSPADERADRIEHLADPLGLPRAALTGETEIGCFCPTPRKGKISQTVLIFSAVALPQPP